MLYFISGKKGGGKSLYMLRQLLLELENSRRNIVTNLPLNLEEIQDELMRRGSDQHAAARITFLDTEQLREYYRHRGSGVVVPFTGRDPDSLDFTVSQDNPVTARGVAYFIDEVQLLYPARNHRTCPAELAFYNTQERKLGDDTYVCAQVLTHVDKQFRELCQEYHYVRNFSKEKFGKFKRGDYFEVRKFYYPVTTGDEVASDKETFTLEVDRVARCYNTAEGIGIKGKAAADTGKKTKGWPLWSVWVAFAVLMVVGWNVVGYMPTVLSYLFFGKTTKAVVSEVTGIQPGQTKVGPVLAASSVPAVVAPSAAVAHDFESAKERVPVSPKSEYGASDLRVTGFLRRNLSDVQVTLSDGRTLTRYDPALQSVDPRRGALVEGRWIPFARPEVRPFRPLDSRPSLSEPVQTVSAEAPRGPVILGSWRLDPDGVQRLVEVERIAQ